MIMDLIGKPMSVIHAAKKHLRRENAKHTDDFVKVPAYEWPNDCDPRVERIAVYRNKDFLVQVVIEKKKFTRMTVNRTQITDDGHYVGDITWDELMEVKRKCGFGIVSNG
jgi:hypothetical protein